MKAVFLITYLVLSWKDNFDLCYKTHYSESYYLHLYISYRFGRFLSTGLIFFFQLTCMVQVGDYFMLCSPVTRLIEGITS